MPTDPPLYRSSAPNVHQITLSTAHPAKFSSAVANALASTTSFDFDRDVLPDEFRGLLDLPRRVLDVERPEVDLVKGVIEKVLGNGNGAGGENLSV